MAHLGAWGVDRLGRLDLKINLTIVNISIFIKVVYTVMIGPLILDIHINSTYIGAVLDPPICCRQARSLGPSCDADRLSAASGPSAASEPLCHCAGGAAVDRSRLQRSAPCKDQHHVYTKFHTCEFFSAIRAPAGRAAARRARSTLRFKTAPVAQCFLGAEAAPQARPG